MSKRDRKWWLALTIERGFQLRHISRLVGLALVSVLISSIALAIFYSQLTEQLMGGQLPFLLMQEETQAIAEKIPGVRKTILSWIAVMSFVNAVLSITIGLFITHRLAGPIYRFKDHLNRVAAGDLTTEICLRKKDELQDVAASINDATARIQMMIMAINDNVDMLEKTSKEEQDKEAFDSTLIVIRDFLSYFKTVQINNVEEAQK